MKSRPKKTWTIAPVETLGNQHFSDSYLLFLKVKAKLRLKRKKRYAGGKNRKFKMTTMHRLVRHKDVK
jgi:hypothetical protein